MTDALTRNQKAYRRKLEREASVARFPARLTANPTKASVIRDPETGSKLDQKSEVFRKCLTLYTARR